MSRLTVTLDGPAGVGKSSLAKALAEQFHLAYLDTGAMFRALALQLGAKGPLPTPDSLSAPGASDELSRCLKEFSFALEGSGPETRLQLNGKVIGQEIRSEEVGAMASRIAPLPEIREFLKLKQRQLGQDFDLVAEGRDMGTVVFPQAGCKFFLDARPEVRAGRRFEQLKAQNMPVDLELLTRQIKERDDMDRSRALAPLAPARDAIIVDTSDLDIDAVFAVLCGHMRARVMRQPDFTL